MDEMLLRAILKALVMPPLVNVLAIVFAILVLNRWRLLRDTVIGLSALSLLALSLPISTQYLARQVELYPALKIEKINPEKFQAIIVLGAGRQHQAREYGLNDEPSSLGLERLRYAAYLQRKTKLPILVTGGAVRAGDVPEADFMARVIEHDFGGTVKWQEPLSRTTWENASYSRQLVEPDNVQQVLLVTHAWHMTRAVYSFEQAGFSVTAAPTAFKSTATTGDALFDYVPQSNALLYSSYMLHELLGTFWYRFSA